MIGARASILIVALPIIAAGCSQSPRPVDIDAPGYGRAALRGDELLDVGIDYSLSASVSNFLLLRQQVDDSGLSEEEKHEIRRRIEFLDEQAAQDRLILFRYRKPGVSDADKRQVFRAIVDRLATTTEETRHISQRLRETTGK